VTPGVLRGVKAGNVDPATLVFVAAVGKGTVAEGAKFAGAGVIVAEPVDEIRTGRALFNAAAGPRSGRSGDLEP